MAHRRLPLTLLAVALAAGSLQAQMRPMESRALAGLRGAEARRASLAEGRLLAQRHQLGLDESHGFAFRNVHTDEFGQTHARFQQTYQGVKVWGGDVVTHMDAEGALLPLTHTLAKGIRLNVLPSMDASEILAVAHRELAPKGPYTVDPSTELVVYPMTVQARHTRARHKDEAELNAADVETQVLRHVLAYHVHTELINGAEETRSEDYLIDAHTGAILKKWSTLHTAASAGTGKSQWYGTVNLNTNSTGSGFELRDMIRGTAGTFGNNITTNMNNGTSGNGSIFTDLDNAWGDGLQYNGTAGMSANAQTAAVDGHRGMQATWDFFKNVYGRNGIDGTGKATFSRMHYSSNYDNAFWQDSCFCMTYGDGAPGGSVGEADLDTAGHEMTHGVCASTANLVYSGESGGLNESNSDIFGTSVEFYVLGGGGVGSLVPDNPGSGSKTANYTLFEQSYSNGATPLRYMYKPSKDGSSKDAWYSGIGSIDVHFSSGPMNRAWYFMARGSSSSSTSDFYSSYLPAGMSGIGNDKAARIWYRALTTYLTSSSNYAAARTASISSAKDLYGAGSAEEQSVWNAFAAINVGSKWSGGGTTALAATITTPSGNVIVASGSSVSFAGSATGGTSPYTYNWTFGDGGTATTASASHTYTNSGTTSVNYTATFKVTDAVGATSSAIRTITVSPATTPTPSSERMVNGGFESGATAWSGTTGVISTWSGQPARTGTKNAWICGNGSTATETLAQTVSIPSTAASASFSFWMHIDTAETTSSIAYDKFTIQVRNSFGTVLQTLATYSNLNKATGYVQKAFDLSAYKGQTIQIYFKGTEDFSLQTSFVLDDVSLTTK